MLLLYLMTVNLVTICVFSHALKLVLSYWAKEGTLSGRRNVRENMCREQCPDPIRKSRWHDDEANAFVSGVNGCSILRYR